MKRFLLIAALFMPALPAQAKLNVFACEPEWAALAQEIGGERLQIFVATTAQQDPHRIEARPSLIAKMRQAELLICTGADLEAGWLPMLLRQAGNGRVQAGQPGHFMAAEQVERLEMPARLDRALGDIHAQGNPHVHTDPRRVLRIAERLGERLAQIDAGNGAYYRSRWMDFRDRWQAALAVWELKAAPLRGVRAVSHHQDWVYLYDWLGLQEVARLEPRPGIPPSAAYLMELSALMKEKPARFIVRTPYQDQRPGEWLAARSGTPVVVLPYTVGGSNRASDLFKLFDETVDKLVQSR